MTLHLHVRSEYFAQIKAGTKREEYRLHNAYWVRRLFEVVDPTTGEVQMRKYDSIVIYNAYKPGPENRIAFPWRGWRLTCIHHPHFGAGDAVVFAIHLDRGGRA